MIAVSEKFSEENDGSFQQCDILSAFINDVSLGSDDGSVSSDCVQVMNIHKAKGLEFKVVFIVALEDGVSPLLNQDMEEERRLLYVAVTRARESLYLTHSKERVSYTDGEFNANKLRLPSPFINELFGNEGNNEGNELANT